MDYRVSVMVDLVPTHSSSQVEWFAAARRPSLGAGGGFHEELQPGAGCGRRGPSGEAPRWGSPRGHPRHATVDGGETVKTLVKHGEKSGRTRRNVGIRSGVLGIFIRKLE